METETIILIITNIVVPIVVAIITGSFQAKKYKKEIELLNVTHENRIKEITSEYEHKIEMLELQHKHQQELETQKTGNLIVEKLTESVWRSLPMTGSNWWGIFCGRKVFAQRMVSRTCQKSKAFSS